MPDGSGERAPGRARAAGPAGADGGGGQPPHPAQRAERERRSRRPPDSPAAQLASCSDAWPGSSPDAQPAISAAMASGGPDGSPDPGYSGRDAIRASWPSCPLFPFAAAGGPGGGGASAGMTVNALVAGAEAEAGDAAIGRSPPTGAVSG